MKACDACLRRSGLLAELSGQIEVAARQRRRLPELLALGDRVLVRGLGLKQPPTVDVDRIKRDALSAGLAHVCRHDPLFPAPLLDAPDCCAALFCAGDTALLESLANGPAVAIVGSRRASGYGLEVARRLAHDLAVCRVPVVSGMAFGVDAAAHEGALRADGLTVAVLACGADRAYPSSHRQLYGRIVRHGLVVSEFPPGFRPRRWCFPARNRIMAGIAAMTIVAEGRADSGSLITAGLAQDLGREVGAVPGPITSQLSAGPNDLLADGACVVRGAGDVLDVLFGAGAAELWDADHPRVPADLSPDLRALLDAVEKGAHSAQQIAAQPTKVSEVAEVVAGLSELELLGLVRCDGAGRYLRCA